MECRIFVSVFAAILAAALVIFICWQARDANQAHEKFRKEIDRADRVIEAYKH